MAGYHLSIRSETFHGELCQRMHDDLNLAGMAERTVHGYLRAVRQLLDCCRTPGDRITEQQLRRFHQPLADRRSSFGRTSTTSQRSAYAPRNAVAEETLPSSVSPRSAGLLEQRP